MPNSPRSWNPGKSTIRWIFWDVQRNCNGYFNPSVGKLYFFSVSEFEVLFLYRFQVGTQLKFLLNSYELAYKTNISRVLTTRPFRSTFFDWPPLCPRCFFFYQQFEDKQLILQYHPKIQRTITNVQIFYIFHHRIMKKSTSSLTQKTSNFHKYETLI